MCEEVDNNFCWCYHSGYIDDLYPPDIGAGNQIRLWFRVYLYEWLWGYDNAGMWFFGPILFFPLSNIDHSPSYHVIAISLFKASLY